MPARDFHQQEGQVGIVVLLTLVVAATVVVSLSSRSVSELKISRQEQESTRALNLAESGIEDLLSENVPAGSSQRVIDGVPVDYKIVDSNNVGPIQVLPGHTVEVNLVGAVAQTMSVSWSAGCSGNAAVLVTFFNGNTNTLRRYILSRTNVDGITNNPGVNSYVNSSCTFPSLQIQNGDEFARIKGLYQPLTLTASGSDASFPIQYRTVKTSATLADGTTRSVEVNKFNPTLPSVFDYVVFSGTNIVKSP